MPAPGLPRPWPHWPRPAAAPGLAPPPCPPPAPAPSSGRRRPPRPHAPAARAPPGPCRSGCSRCSLRRWSGPSPRCPPGTARLCPHCIAARTAHRLLSPHRMRPVPPASSFCARPALLAVLRGRSAGPNTAWRCAQFPTASGRFRCLPGTPARSGSSCLYRRCAPPASVAGAARFATYRAAAAPVPSGTPVPAAFFPAGCALSVPVPAALSARPFPAPAGPVSPPAAAAYTPAAPAVAAAATLPRSAAPPVPYCQKRQGPRRPLPVCWRCSWPVPC